MVSTKSFLAAIPLFDSKMSVEAYRLCERNASKLLGTSNDYQEMSDMLLTRGIDLVSVLGIEPFAGDKPLFINLNQYLIFMDIPTNMPVEPDKLVCVMPKSIPQNEDLLAKCRNLKSLGYALAWENPSPQAAETPLMYMVDYLILDARASSYSSQIITFSHLLRSKRLVLTNISTPQLYESLCRGSIPGMLYSGGFYSRPITKGARGISPLKINALRLIREANEEDADLSFIAQNIERDPSLSISLLRFINSPAVGMRQYIDSIRQAVAILGQKEVRRWVIVAVSVQMSADSPNEITKLSLIRAKFAENLAPKYELALFAPNIFLAGLFSLLDIILNKPMAEAIEEIAVDERVKEALVNKSGDFYEVLDMVYAYERADWENATLNMVRNNLDIEDVTEAFIDALIWYKKLLEDTEM